MGVVDLYTTCCFAFCRSPSDRRPNGMLYCYKCLHKRTLTHTHKEMQSQHSHLHSCCWCYSSQPTQPTTATFSTISSGNLKLQRSSKSSRSTGWSTKATLFLKRVPGQFLHNVSTHCHTLHSIHLAFTIASGLSQQSTQAQPLANGHFTTA
jgi:hypothetical protein